MRENDLRSLRSNAEKAVADMPDGDLKVKAFEVILGHLLSQGTASPISPAKKDSQEPVERRQVRASNTCAGRVLVLKDQGFFAQPRTMNEIKDELARHGWHYSLGALSGKLQSLVQRRALRRVKQKVGKRTVWTYAAP